jgi:signal transduction histidine kinase
VIASLKRKKGASMFAIGSLISLICFVLFANQGTFRDEAHFVRDLNTVRFLLYMFSWLSIVASISAYLAWDFSMTSEALKRRLQEVNVLSAKNVQVEKEKQEILAAQNQELERKVAERTQALNQSLEDLKSTQKQLIQSEKMASLGELTAGIAHEIQNPLNFVNNFSDLNREMLDELQEELKKGDVREAAQLAENIRENEAKINLHGKRADGIVKSMLQHSRSSAGIREQMDVNRLVEEYVRLAYHGYRARQKEFNVTLDMDLDPGAGKADMVSQDIGRVLLNLLNNAFYAVQEKARTAGATYKPTVSVRTRRSPSDTVIIEIEDNGSGIPDSAKEKIFQPFFTTKPTGQGTGLGLSLSYDIVNAHGGEIDVNTKGHDGTEFVIQLPVTS